MRVEVATKISILTAIGRIIDSLIDRLYELAEERDAKNKPATKPATSGASSADASSLDLKVRSLRTRLRNAENTTATLAKQQKDVEVKIKMNHQEVSRNIYCKTVVDMHEYSVEQAYCTPSTRLANTCFQKKIGQKRRNCPEQKISTFLYTCFTNNNSDILLKFSCAAYLTFWKGHILIHSCSQTIKAIDFKRN